MALGLAACATYHAQPLPARAELATKVAPGGVAPLDMDRIATLAVLDNPDLNAARASLHVAQAQAFAAGLVPDPQFSYAGEHPDDHVLPGDPRYPEVNAYGLELDLDLRALLAHPLVRAATRQDLRQARLELLWQEWQTLAEARTLYVQQSIAAERVAFLAPAERVYALAAERSQRARAAGNVTLEQTSADLAVLLDMRARLGSAQRSLLQAQRQLRALIGVGPQVDLPLQPLASPALPARADVELAAARLPRHRPDLAALQAGYAAQEARVRTAVLEQFPDISIGFTRTRDSTDTHSIGGVVNLTLPLFDRGRGRLAVESATRERLRAEYQARLDQASSDVWQLWAEQQQLAGQLRALRTQLPPLQRSVEAARRAYQAARFPAASYLTLVASYLNAEELQAELQQNLWSDSIALATVLGTQLQPAAAGSS